MKTALVRPDVHRMRSLLSVPANRPAFLAKAAASQVDALFLDLEDSVFAEQKIEARRTAAQAIEQADWHDKRLMVRVNAMDTEWGFRDLVDLGSGAGFPGLVLAAARPDLHVTLVETRERKWSFLLAAARTEWRFGRDRRRHVDPHD